MVRDLVGQTFGSLRVEARHEGVAAGRKILWVCVCECGGVVITRGTSLRLGVTKRCRRCANTRHGHAAGKRTPTYSTWLNMLQRCENPKNPNYPDWGGSGIRVDERWYSFENFLADMGERPADTTLDRVERTLGYTKTNCRWATRTEQNRNRDGVKLTQELADEIREMLAGGATDKDLAALFDISAVTVRKIRYGEVWVRDDRDPWDWYFDRTPAEEGPPF